MKRFLLPLFSCMLFIKGQSQNNVDSFPEYKGKDLGLTYSTKKSSFRVWAPTAEMVQLNVYDNSKLSPGVKTIAMDRSTQGTWTATLKGDQLGKYYTFNIKYKGAWLDEVPDPYAKAVGTNGKQAMIVDLAKTNPNGWNKDRSPMLKNSTDAIIYELHIRDASIDKSSGITQKGKYLGLTEKNTKNNFGLSTGLDHLVDLGVTHVHLLPFFDYNSVNETDSVHQQYNWGYDPLNYNTPEGSYASSTKDG